MRSCPLCGKRYDGEDYHYICGDCWDDGVWDGSEEQKWLVKGLYRFANPEGGQLSEWDLKLIADSAAFMDLCEKALPLVESRCFANLLRKVMARVR